MGKDDTIAKEMEKTRNYTLENQQFTPKSWRWMGDDFPVSNGWFFKFHALNFPGCIRQCSSCFRMPGSHPVNFWSHGEPELESDLKVPLGSRDPNWDATPWGVYVTHFNLCIEYIQVSVAKYIKIYLYKLNTNHKNNPIISTVLIPYFRRNHLYPKQN